MIQLRVLDGKQAGQEVAARRFPFSIGRSRAADLCLEEAGVWDRHCAISLDSHEGFRLQVDSNALADLNGQRVQQAPLRNGDLIQLGSIQLRFWLAAARQRSQRVREWATWGALGLLLASELALIYRLTG